MGRKSWRGVTKWRTMAVCCLALGMSMMDMFMVNVALPRIGQQLGAGFALVGWAVTGYMLMVGVLPVASGRLGDLFGRRRVFRIGMVIFLLSSLGSGLSWDIYSLIGFRVIQGVGNAMMTPLTLALIVAAFPAHQRGMALGIWGGVSGLGLILGPVIGGVLIALGDWHWIFLFNLPIGLLAFLLTPLWVAESRDESAPRQVDWWGLLVLTSALLSIMLGLSLASRGGLSEPRVLMLLMAGLFLLVVFIKIEKLTPAPLVDLSLFTTRTFVVVCLAALAFFTAIFGSQPHISMVVQQTWGYTALEAGLVYLPGTVLVALITPFSGWLGGRLKERLNLVIFAGAVVGGISVIPLMFLGDQNTFLNTMFPVSLLRGLGIGLFMSPSTLAAVSALPPEKGGLASGIFTMSRQLGTALGVAMLSAVYLGSVSGSLDEASAVYPVLGEERSRVEIGQFRPVGEGEVLAASRKIVNSGYGVLNRVCLGLAILAALMALMVRHRLKREDGEPTEKADGRISGALHPLPEGGG